MQMGSKRKSRRTVLAWTRKVSQHRAQHGGERHISTQAKAFSAMQQNEEINLALTRYGQASKATEKSTYGANRSQATPSHPLPLRSLSVYCYNVWRRVCSRPWPWSDDESQLPKLVRTWGAFAFSLANVLRATTAWTFRHLNFQKWSENGVFCTF